MKSIIIYTIPHLGQRYDTVGDWVERETIIAIRSSELPDWRHEFLIAFHELVEAIACKHAGITQAAVDAFDFIWPKDLGEPGDDPTASYHAQHRFASKMEREMAEMLDVDWDEYCKAVDSLTHKDVNAP